jgi:hypothetical protein
VQPGHERVARAQIGVPREIAIARPEFLHAVSEAYRGDPGVVDSPSDCARALDEGAPQVEVRGRLSQQAAARMGQPGLDRLERLRYRGRAKTRHVSRHDSHTRRDGTRASRGRRVRRSGTRVAGPARIA